MTMDLIVSSLPPKSSVICWMPNYFFLAELCLHSSLLRQMGLMTQQIHDPMSQAYCTCVNWSVLC